MSGLSAVSFLTFFLLYFLSAEALAQTFKGEIINEGAIVYKSADFDSKQLGYLKKGTQYPISKKIYGAFHRIRVGKTTGYVADIDVKPLNFKRSLDKKIEKKIQAESEKTQRPFSLTRYVGFFLNQIQYQEETMGKNLSENLTFFGMKMSGPDVFVEGDMPTEINLLFFNGAPSYYEKYTGQYASGWMLLNNYMLLMNSPWSKSSMGYFGFGPLFRYSKFDLATKNASTGKITNYLAQDAALGVSFEAGAALKVGPTALRLEVQYHWEKYRYFAYGAALQFPF